MSGLMGLFGQGSRANKPISKSTAMRTQSAIEGRPLAIGAGQNRISGNIIWYGDYLAKKASSAQGGKGGAFSGKGATESYVYSCSFIISIGQQIDQVLSLNNGSQYDFFYTPDPALKAALLAKGFKVTTKDTFGATFFTGSFAQAAWSYMTSAHPTEALAYRGEALACFANLSLGSSPAMPNFNFEVLWDLNTDVAAFGPDANPADWVQSFLTDADWGAGFPSVLVAATTDYQLWARATGMLVSPLLDGQVAANSHLAELMQGTIAEFVWSGGQLKIVPYAEADITGNGYTYVADVTPVYELYESDFLPCEHGPDVGSDNTLVKIARTDPSDIPNRLTVEYLDRANLYNPKTITSDDDAQQIAANRWRPSDNRAHHFFAVADAASRSASMQLRRLRNQSVTYYFRLGPQFILLDPMDLVTLTVDSQGMDGVTVRIKEIQKNGDGSLAFTAEEFYGAAAPELYSRQESAGTARNVNEEPGSVADPVVFEPTYELAGALEVWIAVTGDDLTTWGGANVWVTTDPASSSQQIGQVVAPSRMGVTTAQLPSVTEAVSGQTVDNTNTLSVDLTSSEGELDSGTAADMTALNTICYVDGEVIAYQNATLTGTNAYDLAPMVRGAYGTTIATHAAGSAFVRLDERLVKVPFTPDRVGQTLYIKLQSFNQFGGGTETLDSIEPYTYTIEGTALAVALPDVENARQSYKDKTSNITWDEVTDFRGPRYEIRLGASWEAGITLSTVAHPPFTVYGDGTYWVKAVAEPAPNLIVYSTTGASVSVVGAAVPDQINAVWDEYSTGWTGTITGDGQISGGFFETTADHSVAYYTIPVGHFIANTFPRATRITIEFAVAGVVINSDVLSLTDFLGTTDLLGSAATAQVRGWPEIYVLASGGSNDVYTPTDIFSEPDVYTVGGGGSASWQKYSPGSYLGDSFAMRLGIESLDATVKAVATAFTISAYVDARVDHISNYALGSGGEAFTFRPDDAVATAAFNGGPDGATNPQVIVAMQNPQTGDYATVTSLSLTGCTIQCFNSSGVGVARTISVAIVGW